MKRYLQSRRLRVVAVVVVALMSTWAVGAVRDTYKVGKMTEKMKTVCVGRILIDLPEEARVELYGGWIDGFNIDAYKESDEAFRARVAAREAEIRTTPDRLGGNKNLESVRELKTDSGLAGKMFVHGRYVNEGNSTNGIAVEHFRYEGVALDAYVHGHGISIDVTAKKYKPEYIDDLPKLVSQLVANPGNTIPTEPGYCIDLAYIRDPLKAEQGERVTMAAGLPSHPDIGINFDTIVGAKPDSHGLLERTEEAHARAPAIVNMRFTNLRAAPRTIGGFTGDELVERVVEENFSIVYGFQWEVNGKPGDVFTPDLTLMMKTGSGDDGPVPSSLAQPAAMALWDKISSSIRIRPTEAPKVSASEPATRLGAYASAGETCPADGWWECNSSGNGVTVHGGQRQYIRQGERMPQALLLPPQTVWEKVRGLQPSYEDRTPTPWKLVDRRSRRRVVPEVPLAQATSATPVAATAAAGAEALGRASVGAYAITGNPCPASGWWQCQESDALDGTRWFAQGSQLPAATFAVPVGVFGEAKGTPKTKQRRGTWQLVRLAQTPEAVGKLDEMSEKDSDRPGAGSRSDGSTV